MGRTEKSITGTGPGLPDYITKSRISGESVGATVSGNVTARVSGAQLRIRGYDYVSGMWRELAVDESGQMTIKATVADIVTAKVSGETVLAKVSGESVVSKVSGETVKISGETIDVAGSIVAKTSGETHSLASGQIVAISGQTVDAGTVTANVSGETVVAKTSGEPKFTPVALYAGVHSPASVSGGSSIKASGDVVAVHLKVPSSNSGDMYIGQAYSQGDDGSPYSGFGLLMEPGDAKRIEIDELVNVYVMATVSGESVNWAGEGRE